MAARAISAGLDGVRDKKSHSVVYKAGDVITSVLRSEKKMDGYHKWYPGLINSNVVVRKLFIF